MLAYASRSILYARGPVEASRGPEPATAFDMSSDKSATLSLERYSPDARGWIVSAQALADERGHEEVTPLDRKSVV